MQYIPGTYYKTVSSHMLPGDDVILQQQQQDSYIYSTSGRKQEVLTQPYLGKGSILSYLRDHRVGIFHLPAKLSSACLFLSARFLTTRLFTIYKASCAPAPVQQYSPQERTPFSVWVHRFTSRPKSQELFASYCRRHSELQQPVTTIGARQQFFLPFEANTYCLHMSVWRSSLTPNRWNTTCVDNILVIFGDIPRIWDLGFWSSGYTLSLLSKSDFSGEVHISYTIIYIIK